jgi:tetratricopeptide (TPR) repeat protein
MTPRDWHELGVDQELNDRLDDAVFCYGRALLHGGPDVQIAFDLASVLAELGHTDRAIERYRQVVELDPLRQDAWVNLGDLLATDGQSELAVEALQCAVELDPNDPAARYNLADVLDGIGEFENARPQWEMFLRLSPMPGPRRRYAMHRRGSVSRSDG